MVYDPDKPVATRIPKNDGNDDEFSALLSRYQKQEKKVLKTEKIQDTKGHKESKFQGQKVTKAASKKGSKKDKKKQRAKALQQVERERQSHQGRSASPVLGNTSTSIGNLSATADSTAASAALDPNLTALLPSLANDLAILAALTQSLNGTSNGTPSVPGAPVGSVAVPSPYPTPAPVVPTASAAPSDPRLRLQQARPNPTPAITTTSQVAPTAPAANPSPSIQPTMPPPAKKHNVLCRFAKFNGCGKGDYCPFSHDLKLEACKFFSEKGFCRLGDQCPFSHSRP
ncbi:hypothetical protein BJ085DRAFT_40353 [Dimargaris cristalligena]|uniref:C3H1-type domain-containing protein n=1 Tax=Dimargaris cristalligena TaxID=215637 RepID=A0A4P9ZTV3_9FUNG|nr:hypothetical protein BJ085DRAFT_40353 [Dimargaris cristalligena]|eukprot:RKP36955.1 hypothetical protein BJ085DRAFT_40353 [Dimargaris cristalligena]